MSSSGESSLTISSLDDSEEFVPWYATPNTEIADVDAERGVLDPQGGKNDDDDDDAKKKADEDKTKSKFVLKIVAILVVGMFTSNADGSLVLATHPTIASEFNDLEDSSWLFTAFVLAGAATQTIVSIGHSRGAAATYTGLSSMPNSVTSMGDAPS